MLGSIISVIAAHINNVHRDHVRAMELWGWSNPMLVIWAVGYLLGLWNGGVPVMALLGMYLYFTVTNWWGLRKYKQDPLEE